jgi:hypothetical protein
MNLGVEQICVRGCNMKDISSPRKGSFYRRHAVDERYSWSENFSHQNLLTDLWLLSPLGPSRDPWIPNRYYRSTTRVMWQPRLWSWSNTNGVRVVSTTAFSSWWSLSMVSNAHAVVPSLWTLQQDAEQGEIYSWYFKAARLFLKQKNSFGWKNARRVASSDNTTAEFCLCHRFFIDPVCSVSSRERISRAILSTNDFSLDQTRLNHYSAFHTVSSSGHSQLRQAVYRAGRAMAVMLHSPTPA